ncbi:MAG: baseplate J/gp47 family protein [Chloroflexi bacterium]|nr:baseplate J/gp47 family protein [Chloroflexota bacterium]
MASPFDRDFSEFLGLFVGETEGVILARMVTWANEGVTAGSPQWVDTREGTFWRTEAVPLTREVARLYDLAGTEAVAAAFPLWAWADYLDDHAEVQTLFRLASTPAAGRVTFTAAVGTVIAAGTEVGVPLPEEDAEAPSFQVVTGVTVAGPLAAPTGLAGTPSASGGTLATATYRYVVTAFDGAGETVGSGVVAVAVVGPAGSVNLSWTAVANAAGYRVYRGTAAGGPYNRVAEVTAPGYLDIGAAASGPVPPVANTTGGAVFADVAATEPGSFGNVGAGAVTEVLSPLVATVTNALPMAGGTDVEDDDELRQRVLDAYEGRGAGSARDYRAWARAYPGVGRVTVIPLWNGAGTVRVIVTTITGGPVSQAVLDGLQALLDPIPGQAGGDAPVGATVTVSTATATALTWGATVECEPGYSLDGAGATVALRTEIEDAVEFYVGQVQPGGEVVRQQVIGRIVGVVGVHDVANVVLNGAAANVSMSLSPPQVPFVSGVPALVEGPV